MEGKIYHCIIILILSGLLIPISVSAQCGDCDDRNPCTKDICNGTKCEHIPLSCYGSSFITYANPRISSNGSVPLNASAYNASVMPQSGGRSVLQSPVSCDDGNPCTNDYPGLAGCIHDPVNCDEVSEQIRDYCGCPPAGANKDTSPLDPQTGIAFGVFLSPESAGVDDAGQETASSPPMAENQAAPAKDGLIGATEDSLAAVTQENLTGPIQENLTGPAQENLTGPAQENLTGPIQENLTGAVLDSMTGVASENLTGDALENMTGAAMAEMSALIKNVSECDDGDPCTDDHLVNGKCMHFLKTCNDNDPTNFDYCYEGECIHSPINCDDGDACTIDSYNGTACVYRPVNCDDGNPCTEDSCNKLAGCQNMEINRDNDYCTVECEDGKPVFKPLICDDGDPCTIDYCDKARGCVHVPICGPFGHHCFPYCYYLPLGHPYPYPYVYQPVKYYYPYSPAPVIAAPSTATASSPAPSTAAASSSPPTKSYTIESGKVIILPWNETVTALDTLQVENGIAFSSGSGIRFARQMGTSKVYQLLGGQNISDRAEMVGLSWPEGGIPFTLTLIQPNGITLSVKDGDKNALHLTGSNYNYYFLRDPAKGYWTAVVTPEQSSASGIGFSLISGLVEGIASP